MGSSSSCTGSAFESQARRTTLTPFGSKATQVPAADPITSGGGAAGESCSAVCSLSNRCAYRSINDVGWRRLTVVEDETLEVSRPAISSSVNCVVAQCNLASSLPFVAGPTYSRAIGSLESLRSPTSLGCDSTVGKSHWDPPLFQIENGE